MSAPVTFAPPSSFATRVVGRTISTPILHLTGDVDVIDSETVIVTFADRATNTGPSLTTASST